jgi:histidinol-phosphate aminotransferase
MRGLSRREFARALGTGLGAAVAVPGAARRAWASLPRDAPADAIQLNSNENPYGPSKAALDAVTGAAAASGSRYPDAAEARLVEAIARLHRVELEQVLLGCGSGEVLRMAAAAFAGTGKDVVVSEPTFEAVLGYARVTRAESVQVPQTADFRHDLERMAQQSGDHTGLAYVCNPNNPTGTIVTREDLDRFIKRVPSSTTIVVDEAYAHFVEDVAFASAFQWLPRQENLVVVRTFSKIYGLAGMRLGYAVGHLDRIRAMRAYATWDNANALALAAAQASLEDDQHVPRHRRLNMETRRWLVRELEATGRRVIPSHANFLMVEIGPDVTPVIQAFQARKILVGRRFPSMSSWLRVSIGTPEQMKAFMEAFRAIVSVRSGAA